MAIVGVDYRRTHSPSWLACFEGWRLLDDPGESTVTLLQLLLGQ